MRGSRGAISQRVFGGPQERWLGGSLVISRELWSVAGDGSTGVFRRLSLGRAWESYPVAGRWGPAAPPAGPDEAVSSAGVPRRPAATAQPSRSLNVSQPVQAWPGSSARIQGVVTWVRRAQAAGRWRAGVPSGGAVLACGAGSTGRGSSRGVVMAICWTAVVHRGVGSSPGLHRCRRGGQGLVGGELCYLGGKTRTVSSPTGNRDVEAVCHPVAEPDRAMSRGGEPLSSRAWRGW